MAKYDAFCTQLQMGDGALQVETATVVGTITTTGDATFTITSTGMAGTPLAITVAVVEGDTAAMVAAKARAAIEATAAVTAMYYVGGVGATVTLTRKVAVANVADLNIAYADDTSVGLIDDATSDATIAGGGAETFNTIAAVRSIGGPGLSLDTEDVTTHDSTSAFEEVVATILRTGELALDIVYDPAGTTHNASTGLVFKLENKILTNFKLIFPDSASTTWTFSGYVTGFEPGEPHDGALTAAVKIKISGAPTLA